jgi:hypothetical protein
MSAGGGKIEGLFCAGTFQLLFNVERNQRNGKRFEFRQERIYASRFQRPAYSLLPPAFYSKPE